MQPYLGYFNAVMRLRYRSKPDEYPALPDDVGLSNRSYCMLLCTARLCIQSRSANSFRRWACGGFLSTGKCARQDTKQPGPMQQSIGPESMQHLQPDCSDLINVSLVYGQSCSSSH